MICKTHPKYEAKHKPQCDCLTCWIMWEAKQSKNEVPPDPQHGREPDKVKPLAQYLLKYIDCEVERSACDPLYVHPYNSSLELFEQALDAYQSTENVTIKIERV